MDMNRLFCLIREEKGATAIEYGLIAGLIAVVIIAAVGFVGGDVTDIFTQIETALDGTAGS
jgi:pilus assembly protein Flp/PilA